MTDPKTGKTVLTEREKEIIERLDDHVYTVSYIETYINRNDSVVANAPVALIAMGVKGFYQAVRQMAMLPEKDFVKGEIERAQTESET